MVTFSMGLDDGTARKRQYVKIKSISTTIEILKLITLVLDNA